MLRVLPPSFLPEFLISHKLGFPCVLSVAPLPKPNLDRFQSTRVKPSSSNFWTTAHFQSTAARILSTRDCTFVRSHKNSTLHRTFVPLWPNRSFIISSFCFLVHCLLSQLLLWNPHLTWSPRFATPASIIVIKSPLCLNRFTKAFKWQHVNRFMLFRVLVSVGTLNNIRTDSIFREPWTSTRRLGHVAGTVV